MRAPATTVAAQGATPRGAQAPTPPRAQGATAGAVVAAGLAVLVLGTLAAVGIGARSLSGLGPWDIRAVWFTLWQAALSASLSVGLAVPVARAFARRRFAGRQALVILLGAPFLLPSIVAILGLVAVFGRRGWINAGLAALGLPQVTIYGWQGVILAHVFFNLPLATRLILQGWSAIPAERLRLAASLGFAPRDIGRHLERPMLREVAPGAWLAVFLVCLTSFTVALALGGGPRATTVELAIYQAFRFDADLGRAATLGLVQVAISLGALALAARATADAGFGAGLDRPADPSAGLAGPGGWRRAADAAVIAAAAAFLLTPLASVLVAGVPRLPSLPAAVWAAAGRSLWMALTSAGLTLGLALPVALALAAPASRRRRRWIEAAGMLPLVASPLVLGTGLFLVLRHVAAPQALAIPVTVGVNAVMALPFALRALIPAARAMQADYGRLAASLGMTGAARLRLLVLPRLRGPLGFGGGLAAALAMGDLGVIALFGDARNATLPLLLYQLMGRYRLQDAAGAAVLLMAMGFALFWIFDRWGRRGWA